MCGLTLFSAGRRVSVCVCVCVCSVSAAGERKDRVFPPRGIQHQGSRGRVRTALSVLMAAFATVSASSAASSDPGPTPLDPGPSSLGPGLSCAPVLAPHARADAPPPPTPAGASAFAIVEQPPGWLAPGLQVEVEMREEGLYGSMYRARVLELRAMKAHIEFTDFCVEGADEASGDAPLLQVCWHRPLSASGPTRKLTATRYRAVKIPLTPPSASPSTSQSAPPPNHPPPTGVVERKLAAADAAAAAVRLPVGASGGKASQLSAR